LNPHGIGNKWPWSAWGDAAAAGMPRTQNFFTRFHNRRRTVIRRPLRGAVPAGSPRRRM